MHIIRYIFVFALFFAAFATGFCQDYVSKNYNIKDGLPDIETFHIIQDSKGYIWIATSSGVAKFDGDKFEIYDGDNGLPDNTVLEIHEDNKGRIWFIPLSGKLSYLEDDNLKIWPHFNSLAEQCDEDIHPVKTSFKVDSLDNIYISLYRNGAYWISSDGKVENKKISRDRKIIIENNEISYFIHGSALLNRSIASKRKEEYAFISINGTEMSYALTENEVHNMGDNASMLFSKGYLYMAFGNTLLTIDPELKITKADYPSRIVWLSSCRNNIMWVGTYGSGIYGYSDIELSDLKYHLLKDIMITSIAQDNENGYWVTTYNSGIFYFPSLKIKSVSTDFFEGDVINDIDIISDHDILITTDKALYNYNYVTEKSKILARVEKGILTSSLYQRKSKQIYFGGNYFFYKMDSNNNISKIPFRHDSIRVGRQKNTLWGIKEINQNDEGEILISSNSGLVIVIDDTVKNNTYLDNQTRIKVFDNAYTDDGTLWLGCLKGLFYKKGNQITRFENDLLKEKRINALEYDNDKKVLWIGTKSNGLFKKYGDSLVHFTVLNGLPSNMVTSLKKCYDLLLIGTSNGLVVYNESDETERLEVLSENNGLINNFITSITCKDSLIAVATKEGISVFNTSFVRTIHDSQLFYIDNISINDKDTLIISWYDLEYYQNFIGISFVCLTFQDQDNVRYKYKMSGVDVKYNISENKSVRYTTLPPGKYQFSVCAVSMDGTELGIPKTITFVINKPFWKTWWFIGTVAVFIILILGLLYFNRDHQLKKRNLLRIEVNKHMQKALSSQMNPHFIFNSLSAIQSYIVEQDSKNSSRYLAKVASLIRLVLDNSMKETIPIKDDLDALEIYLELEKLRLEEILEYEIVVDGAIDQDKYRIPPLLIQPFVENSIWHGITPKKSTGKVIIDLKAEPDYIKCCIKDNGVGRHRAKEMKGIDRKKHKSYGEGITISRLDSINDLYGMDCSVKVIDLFDDNNLACGTIVEIKLPCFRE